MQLPRTLLLALLSALAAAQSQPNPFNVPSNFSATGGQALELKWNPTTSGTVSLVLRSGASNDLAEGTVIASSIANSGSYTWTPSNDLTRGSDYTIEIVDDSDPTQVNYTPYFVLDTTNTVATSTPSISLGAPTTSLTISSTASPTTSSGGRSTGSSTTESTTVISGTGSSTATSIVKSTTTTGVSSTTVTNGGSSSASASSPASASSSIPASSTTGSTGAGVRPTVVAGMLGVVALGAFAL